MRRGRTAATWVRRRSLRCQQSLARAAEAPVRNMLTAPPRVRCAGLMRRRGKQRLGKRGFIRVDARRLDRDGMQGGFCSKYRDICKKSNAADRPIQVIARRAE